VFGEIYLKVHEIKLRKRGILRKEENVIIFFAHGQSIRVERLRGTVTKLPCKNLTFLTPDESARPISHFLRLILSVYINYGNYDDLKAMLTAVNFLTEHLAL